jgi:hypothetical protein
LLDPVRPGGYDSCPILLPAGLRAGGVLTATAEGSRMAHIKHLVLYLTLVGLPFLGLLGILRIGRDMSAPMAVHGAYTVAAVGGRGGSCLRGLLADSALAITQSGERIEVRLGAGAVRMDGQLRGDRLTATGELPATDACPAGEPIRFEGLAARVGRGMRLDAHLRAECTACGSLTVEASRPPWAPGAGS